ncbi:MAG: ATP-binding protein [Desulfatibacillaceae bacterium]
MAEKSVYERLSEKIMAPGSPRIPELFAMLIDEQEGEMLLALPGTVPEMAEKFGMSGDEMQAKMNEFFEKGLVFKSIKPEGVRYRMCRDLVQFHDATILWPKATQEYYDLWQEYMEEEWPEYSAMVEQFMPKPFTRIIPIERSVSASQEILPYESVKRLIDENDTIAVTRCTCRLTAKKCDHPLEICLQIGKAADYNIERGTGRQIDKKEAMELIDQAEEAGLIHVTMNKSENMHFICNCCGCCCITMPVMIKYGRKLNDPSRYCAEIDVDACDACETCVDRCWFNAIEVGDVAVVDVDKCMGCGVCQITCPTDAITLKEVRAVDFIPA